GPSSNYAALPSAAKVVLSIIMLVGRLEIFTVLLFFQKIFSIRNKNNNL
ncbi:MAG: hypothetical protein HUK15_08810, partial [Bacteroidales bacterium]|nr:hypothetical protein [Bacteroidales bacterium]